MVQLSSSLACKVVVAKENRGSAPQFWCPAPVAAEGAKVRVPALVVENSPWNEATVWSTGCLRKWESAHSQCSDSKIDTRSGNRTSSLRPVMVTNNSGHFLSHRYVQVASLTTVLHIYPLVSIPGPGSETNAVRDIYYWFILSTEEGNICTKINVVSDMTPW